MRKGYAKNGCEANDRGAERACENEMRSLSVSFRSCTLLFVLHVVINCSFTSISLFCDEFYLLHSRHILMASYY